MIRSEQFYNKLHELQAMLIEHGFSKSGQNVYKYKEGFKAHIILDKWGWDEVNGAGFFIRFIDERCEDEIGIFDANGQLEFNPRYVVENGLISQEEINRMYLNTPLSVVEVFRNGTWFAYFDFSNLEIILETIMPIFVITFKAWVENRKKVQNIQPRKKTNITNKERKETGEILDNLFRDISNTEIK